MVGDSPFFVCPLHVFHEGLLVFLGEDMEEERYKQAQTGTLFCTWASLISLDGTDRSRLFSATQKSIGRAVSIPLCFHSV